jgi:hypothetical protein
MKTKLLILLLLPAFAFAQAPETYKNPILSGFSSRPVNLQGGRRLLSG